MLIFDRRKYFESGANHQTFCNQILSVFSSRLNAAARNLKEQKAYNSQCFENGHFRHLFREALIKIGFVFNNKYL
jgi:hypothetical protein